MFTLQVHQKWKMSPVLPKVFHIPTNFFKRQLYPTSIDGPISFIKILPAWRLTLNAGKYFFIIHVAFCHLYYFAKLFSWKSPMNVVSQTTFYILDSISCVSTTFIQFFARKTYPKCVRKIDDIKKKTKLTQHKTSQKIFMS